MTDKIAAAARQVAGAGAGTEILALTNHEGPASIQGEADGEAAVPGLLRLIADNEREADAFAIACFDDTGLVRARALTRKPIYGIGEAAMREAALHGRFCVVTTLAVSIPVIAANVGAYGFTQTCARVRASDVAVLDLEKEGSAAREKVAAEIARALREDRPDAIVLGCAGMADLADTYARRFGLPVLDGVVAAVRLAERQYGAGGA
jgi:allantoin racemase